MFNLAIDSKLRGCDAVARRVEDVAPSGYAVDRAAVRQKKTGRPVRYKLNAWWDETAVIREARLLALAVIPVAAASLIGQLAAYPNLTPWYAGLVKPPFNPAELGVPAGLDDAVSADGGCGLASFTVRSKDSGTPLGPEFLFRPADAECGLVLDVFRRA
jgi:hypothetical protein